MHPVRALVAPLVLLFAGCRCEEDKPYTPFQIPSAALEVDSARAVGSARPADAGAPRGFTPADTVMAAGRRDRKWRLGQLELVAPKGARFDRAVVTDLDGDANQEAIAWTIPEGADDAKGGSLWLYRDAREPKRLMGVPAFVPTGPDCALTVDLRHSGPATLVLDVASRCATTLIPRSPTRAVSVVAPLAEEPDVLTLRLADAAPREHLEVSLDTTDRDADGRDDIALSMTLRPEGEEEGATAEFIWLDRAAGLARDATKPKKSFEDLGSVQVVRAKGENTSRQVPGRIESARRLFSTVCAESGVARLLDAEGAPLACGDLRQAFAWFAEAELVAALTRKEPAEALGVILRDGWYGEKRSDRTKKRLESLFEKGITKSEAQETTAPVRARQPGSAPRWSPLRFTDGGMLHVATVEGVAELDPGDLTLEPGFDEHDPWPQAVIDGRGLRLLGVGFPCDRNEAVMLLSHRDGAAAPSAPVHLLAARPAGCAGGSAPDPGPIVPLSFTESRHTLVIAGRVVRPLDEAGIPPEPPKRLALPSRLGLLVLDDGKAELWDVRTEQLRDCVAAPGGKRAACIRGLSQVVVFEPTS